MFDGVFIMAVLLTEERSDPLKWNAGKGLFVTLGGWKPT